MWLAWLLAPDAWALTCDEVFRRTSNGEPEASVAAAIRAGADLTETDVKCLQAGGASRVLLDAARWKLAHPAAEAPVPARPAAPAPGAPPPQTRVDITIVGAVFSPTRRDGAPWDKDGDGALGAVGTAANVVTGGVAGAAVGLVRAGASALPVEDPDVEGWAQMLPGGAGPAWQRMALRAGADTLTPEFESPPTWRGWPLEPTTRLRVQLWDRDPSGRDEVDAFELDADDLRDALARGGTHVVTVSGSAGDLVRAVRIRVRASALSDTTVDGSPAAP